MATTSRKSTSRHLNTFQRTKRGLPSQALKPEQRRRRLSFDKEQAAVSDDKDENYVPRSIYKNVNYKAKGENKTSRVMSIVIVIVMILYIYIGLQTRLYIYIYIDVYAYTCLYIYSS